jgi:hypothetical protein
MDLNKVRLDAEVEVKEVPIPKSRIEGIALLGKAGKEFLKKIAAEMVDRVYSKPVVKLKGSLESLKREAQEVKAKLEKLKDEQERIPRYIGDDALAPPWTIADTVRCYVLTFVIVACVVFDGISIATVLQTSGHVVFESFWRAFFLSAIPFTLVVVFEGLGETIELHKHRKLFLRVLLVSAIVSGYAWIVEFGAIFPGLVSSPAQMVQDLMAEAKQGAEHKETAQRFLLLTFLTANLIGATCFIRLMSLLKLHEGIAAEPHPAWARYEQGIVRLQKHLAEVEALMASVQGKLDEFRNARESTIDQAVADFDAFVGSAKGAQEIQERLAAIASKALLIKFLLLANTTECAAALHIWGLSPHYSAEDGRAVFSVLAETVVGKMASGDEVVAYNAVDLQPVARLVIPKNHAKKINPRERLIKCAEGLTALKTFLLTERPHVPERASALHVPQFLGLAGAQLRTAGAPAHILLIGAPLYVDPENPAWSMAGAYPSDGCILAAPSESLFSTKDRRTLLAGVAVHWSYLREDWENPYQRDRITRFWSLYVHSQQGVLATFAADLNLAMQRSLGGEQNPSMRAQLDASDTSVEMRSILGLPTAPPLRMNPVAGSASLRPESSTTAIRIGPDLPANPPRASSPLTGSAPRELPGTAGALQPFGDKDEPAAATPPTAVERVVTASTAAKEVKAAKAAAPPPVVVEEVVERPALHPAPLPAATATNATPDSLVITVLWSAGDVDFDLFVKPERNAEEISYQRAVTERGRYFSKQGAINSERVEVYPPVSLREVECFINFASGWHRSPRATVVVFFNGKSFQSEVTFKAVRGNSQSKQGRFKSEHWVAVDVAAMLGGSTGDAATVHLK